MTTTFALAPRYVFAHEALMLFGVCVIAVTTKVCQKFQRPWARFAPFVYPMLMGILIGIGPGLFEMSAWNEAIVYWVLGILFLTPTTFVLSWLWCWNQQRSAGSRMPDKSD